MGIKFYSNVVARSREERGRNKKWKIVLYSKITNDLEISVLVNSWK